MSDLKPWPHASECAGQCLWCLVKAGARATYGTRALEILDELESRARLAVDTEAIRKVREDAKRSMRAATYKSDYARIIAALDAILKRRK